ncbi:MAG: tetratricopeptide repeat protein, partial [Candidatus Eisenbacteria bacterium]|nr:tetratricopeptide repeat protein [Candidatus Eisenbacteria bacterium]
LERLRDDPQAPALDVDDAEHRLEALRFAAGLPAGARAELALADSLGVSVERHWVAGRYSEAAEDAERRLAIYRRHFGDRHLTTAASADELASLLQTLGEYDSAEPLFAEALETRRSLLGERHVYVGASLNNLGMLYQATGEFGRAREHVASALSILRQELGGDDLNVAAITFNLGLLLQSLGELEAAEEHLLAALETRRSILGDGNAQVAESLNGLAALYYEESDFAAAEPFLRRSTAIWRELLGDEHPHVALSLTNMGALLSARGQYAEAEGFHRQAVEIYRRTLGEKHPDAARALHNLAHALESMGDYAGAEPLFRDALEIRRAAFGDTHPDVAEGLTALAHVVQEAGRYGEAEPLYREALEMHRELLGDEHLEVATDLSNLASLVEEEGRLEEAVSLYEESLAIRERSLGAKSAPVAHSLSSVGHLKLRMCEPAAAEAVLTRAAETYDAARLRAGAGLSRATMALRLRPPSVALAVSRLELGKVEGAWPAAEKALGRALADLLMTSERRSLTESEAAREDSLRMLIGELEAELGAYAAAARSDTGLEAAALAEETRDRLLEAEALWSDFQREMATRYPITEGQTYSLARVQDALGSDAAIVGWIDADACDGRVESWGYVIRGEGEVSWHRCDPGSPGKSSRALSGRYARYREQLSDPRSSLAGLSRDARSIWEARFEPLLPALGGVDELVVLPSGPVLGVPLETLKDEEGELLSDRFALTYAPSATVYAWLNEQGRRTARSGRMLLLGDPPFTDADLKAMRRESASGLSEEAVDETPGSETDRGVRRASTTRTVERASVDGLPRLPGSREEVSALAELSREPTVLLGPEASEQSLVRLAETGRLGGFAVIHMATHALVDDRRPEQSALVLSQVGLPDPLESALKGERICDGLLTAGEIVREWDLGADLVTLSACETGLGKEVVGEGYIGFAHAFLQAGARSLLVSLWKVEDRATSLFMRRFYENRLGAYDDERGGPPGRPMSKAKAVKEAKHWLRHYADADGYRPYEHPYYWSAFILID